MVAAFSLEHADPWAAEFVDVASINAHVSDAVATRIEETRRQAVQGPQGLHSSSLLVLGPAGSGKTHLFARLRKRCGAEASFVLVRPEIGAEMTPRHMLAAIVDSLHRRRHGLEIRQIDAVVGSLYAVLDHGEQRYPMMQLEDLRQSDDRAAKIEEMIASLESRYDEVHSTYLERLLSFPFSSSIDRRGLLAWLSGRELDDTHLRRLGLPGPIADQDVIPALRTLAIAASFGAPIVVVFDQLENLVEDGEDNDRVHAHARLVSELFDNVRGLVLVQMALDAEWQQRISPVLSQSERDRLEARVLTLSLPRPDDREALLSAWTEAIPNSERFGYFPWPLDEQSWSEWRTSPGVTPRTLMVACREAFEGRAPQLPVPRQAVSDLSLEDRLDVQWKTYVERARVEVGEAVAQKRGLDRERIVAALIRSARLLGMSATPRPARKPGDLKLEQDGKAALVFVVQQPNARSVAASLGKAVAAAGSENVVLLRERRIPFPATWKSVTQPLAELSRTPRASWFELDEEHAAQLLALHDFLSSARSRDITDASGSPIDEAAVRKWAVARAPEARWAFAPDLLAPAKAPVSAPQVTPVRAAPVRAVSAPAQRPSPKPVLLDGPAARSLLELRVASVERIVREVRASRPEASRASVVAELRAAGQAIGWVGGTVVFIAGDSL